MSTATYMSADPYDTSSESEFSTHDVFPTRVELNGDENIQYTIVCMQNHVPFNGFYGGRNAFLASRFLGILDYAGNLQHGQEGEVTEMLTQIVNATPTPRAFRWVFIQGYEGMRVVNVLRWAFPTLDDARIAFLYTPPTQFEYYALDRDVFAALQIGTYL